MKLYVREDGIEQLIETERDAFAVVLDLTRDIKSHKIISKVVL